MRLCFMAEMESEMKKSIVLILAILCNTAMLQAKQTQPDPKRVRQIQIRLVEHGYPATTTWKQVQEVCRQVARGHGWQIRKAPDARVLILLGLGNEYSDPDILVWPNNHLDYGGKENDSTSL